MRRVDTTEVLADPHAIDAVAQRWLSIADGDQGIVQVMLEASSVEVGVVGSNAARFRRVSAGHQ